MKPALVIVDMQPDSWGVANEPTLVSTIVEYINRWKEKNLPIVVVTYYGSGKTHKDIVSKLKDYSNKTFVRKHDCGGGAEVLNKVKRKKITHFVMAGVFRCQCVYETATEINREANKPVYIPHPLTGCDTFGKQECAYCKHVKTTSTRIVDKLLKAA